MKLLECLLELKKRGFVALDVIGGDEISINDAIADEALNQGNPDYDESHDTYVVAGRMTVYWLNIAGEMSDAASYTGIPPCLYDVPTAEIAEVTKAIGSLNTILAAILKADAKYGEADCADHLDLCVKILNKDAQALAHRLRTDCAPA